MTEARELGKKLVAFFEECQEEDEAAAELRRQEQLAEDAQAALAACYEPFLEGDDAPSRRAPLNWSDLSAKDPPERSWAIDHWLPMSAVTLLSGSAGAGKSLVAQALASALCLRREYLDFAPSARRVLMWACEDDPAELWRRQVQIAKWLGVTLGEFSGQFFLESYDAREVALAALTDQRLVPTSALLELKAQIGDYKADVVVLDNVARLFAGNENDRHQVTSFIAMLNAAAAATGAAVLLLGHPSKQVGSEYSGSTAWEAAVRARLYLGRTLPDQKPQADEESTPEQEEVRYLCRRKANYSSRDYRKVRYIDGVMVPEVDPGETGGPRANPTSEYARDCVMRAVRDLERMGMQPTASSASKLYLPKLAEQYRLLNGFTTYQFATTMRLLQKSGALVVAEVGKYPNRTPKLGLRVKDSASAAN